MEDRVSRLGQMLRENGYRLTASRQLVLETLVDCDRHLSADELSAEVNSRNSGIGRMTIYRTLDLLCELGLLRPIYQGVRAARYVLLDQGRHHHFICSACDDVFEVEECLIEEAAVLLQDRTGFEVRSHLLELYGICDRCRD